MTARNAVIKANASLFTNTPLDIVPIAIAPANISPTTSFTVSQSAFVANSEVEVEINSNFGTNFLPANFTVNVVVYDYKRSIAYFSSAQAQQNTMGMSIQTPSIGNLDAYVIYAFLTSTDASGKKFISQTAMLSMV
jgi:hypothetical protein